MFKILILKFAEVSVKNCVKIAFGVTDVSNGAKVSNVSLIVAW